MQNRRSEEVVKRGYLRKDIARSSKPLRGIIWCGLAISIYRLRIALNRVLLDSITISVLVSFLFSTITPSYSFALAPATGDQESYQSMLDYMWRLRHQQHNDETTPLTMDGFIAAHVESGDIYTISDIDSKLDPRLLDRLEEIKGAIGEILADSCPDVEDGHVLLRRLEERGIKIQLLVASDEENLPKYEEIDELTNGEEKGQEVRGHASTDYITLIVRRGELEKGEVLLGKGRSCHLATFVAGVCVHEIFARSSMAQTALEALGGQDVNRVRGLLHSLEGRRKQAEQEIIEHGQIEAPELRTELAQLEFDETLSDDLRDYAADASSQGHLPEDIIEIPYIGRRLQPERELTERQAEERASIELQKDIALLIADLKLVIADAKSASTDTQMAGIEGRMRKLLEQIKEIYTSVPVAIQENRPYGFYKDLLAQLKERRDSKNPGSIYQQIEEADRRNDAKALARLNQEAIRNNRLVLKVQMMVAGKILTGRSGLKESSMMRNAALWSLEGALNSAKALEDELHYRTQRLRVAKFVREIETTDPIGNIVRTFRLEGFNIEVLEPAPGQEEPKVSIRQQKWINVHTNLERIQQNIRKGNIAKALEQIDTLIALYNVRYIVAMERYRDIAGELKALRKVIQKLPDAQAPPASASEDTEARIDNIARNIVHPKQRIWVDIQFQDLAAAFRSRIHILAGYVTEYNLIVANKSNIEYYAEKLLVAREKGYLPQRNKNIILGGLTRLVEWTDRGFVYPKQFATIDLKPAIELIERDEFESAEKYLREAVAEMEKRLAEITRISANEKKAAVALYAEFRDHDVSARVEGIIASARDKNFDQALNQLSDLREMYFNQELVEPGYVRAEFLLRGVVSMIRGAQRQKNPEPTIAKLQERLDQVKEDIAHKNSYRVAVTQESGASRFIFINPGTTARGLLAMLKRNPNETSISTGAGWIPQDQLTSHKLRDSTTVTIASSENVSFGDICALDEHDPTFVGLDQQIAQTFDTLRKALGVEDQFISETQFDQALQMQGKATQTELAVIREDIKKFLREKIRGDLPNIYFLPSEGLYLWDVNNHNAAAHFSRDNHSIYINLNFVRFLQQNLDDPIELQQAFRALALHDALHIEGKAHISALRSSGQASPELMRVFDKAKFLHLVRHALADKNLNVLSSWNMQHSEYRSLQQRLRNNIAGGYPAVFTAWAEDIANIAEEVTGERRYIPYSDIRQRIAFNEEEDKKAFLEIVRRALKEDNIGMLSRKNVSRVDNALTRRLDNNVPGGYTAVLTRWAEDIANVVEEVTGQRRYITYEEVRRYRSFDEETDKKAFLEVARHALENNDLSMLSFAGMRVSNDALRTELHFNTPGGYSAVFTRWREDIANVAEEVTDKRRYILYEEVRRNQPFDKDIDKEAFLEIVQRAVEEDNLAMLSPTGMRGLDYALLGRLNNNIQGGYQGVFAEWREDIADIVEEVKGERRYLDYENDIIQTSSFGRVSYWMGKAFPSMLERNTAIVLFVMGLIDEPEKGRNWQVSFTPEGARYACFVDFYSNNGAGSIIFEPHGNRRESLADYEQTRRHQYKGTWVDQIQHVFFFERINALMSDILPQLLGREITEQERTRIAHLIEESERETQIALEIDATAEGAFAEWPEPGAGVVEIADVHLRQPEIVKVFEEEPELELAGAPGQNLVKGDIPESDISNEQQSLIEGGFAVAWNMKNADQVIAILEKETLEDDDYAALLSLLPNLPANTRELLKQNLESPEARKTLAGSIRAESDAVMDALKDAEAYAETFKDEYRQFFLENIKSLEKRRFVVFFSKEGLFANGQVLGHGSANNNSTYIHTSGINNLGVTGIALVLLHEHMDAIRGRHEEDIENEIFDKEIRTPWEASMVCRWIRTNGSQGRIDPGLEGLRSSGGPLYAGLANLARLIKYISENNIQIKPGLEDEIASAFELCVISNETRTQAQNAFRHNYYIRAYLGGIYQRQALSLIEELPLAEDNVKRSMMRAMMVRRLTQGPQGGKIIEVGSGFSIHPLLQAVLNPAVDQVVTVDRRSLLDRDTQIIPARNLIDELEKRGCQYIPIEMDAVNLVPECGFGSDTFDHASAFDIFGGMDYSEYANWTMNDFSNRKPPPYKIMQNLLNLVREGGTILVTSTSPGIGIPIDSAELLDRVAKDMGIVIRGGNSFKYDVSDSKGVLFAVLKKPAKEPNGYTPLDEEHHLFQNVFKLAVRYQEHSARYVNGALNTSVLEQTIANLRGFLRVAELRVTTAKQFLSGGERVEGAREKLSEMRQKLRYMAVLTSSVYALAIEGLGREMEPVQREKVEALDTVLALRKELTGTADIKEREAIIQRMIYYTNLFQDSRSASQVEDQIKDFERELRALRTGYVITDEELQLVLEDIRAGEGANSEILMAQITAKREYADEIKRRYVEHESPLNPLAIDTVIQRCAERKQVFSLFDQDIRVLGAEFGDAIRMSGATGTLAGLKRVLESTGGDIQIAFVNSEAELPVYQGERVWGHAGTYVTAFALPSEMHTPEGRRKIIARLFHEIRARSHKPEQPLDEFEITNVSIANDVMVNGCLMDPGLRAEFAGLTFPEELDIMERDYAIDFESGRFKFIATLFLGAAGAALAGCPKPAPQPQPKPPAVVEPAAPVPIQPAAPAPSSELMAQVQNSAKVIKSIPNGKFTAMFWDTAEIDTANDFKDLAAFGFNEVIVDGYDFEQGNIRVERMEKIIIAAYDAGITSFKFVMGAPDWPYEGKGFAVQATTTLCGKMAELKRNLEQRDLPGVAGIIKGIAIDVEPHTVENWDYDLGPYCSLHNQLESIASKNKLTYNRIEAFWYAQPTTEDGKRIKNYTTVTGDDVSYIMSYRATGNGTFGMASFIGEKSYHVGGFDLVETSPIGYSGAYNSLPRALSKYVELSKAQRGKTFNGAFVHAGSINDFRVALNGWREGRVVAQDQNLAKGIPGSPNEVEAEIRAEQDRLINEGFAVAWSMRHADEIMNILQKDGELTEEDCDVLVDFFPDLTDRTATRGLLIRNLAGRPVRQALIRSIQAQRHAIFNISLHQDIYRDMFKEEYRDSVEANMPALRNRRFVIFFSNEGFFAQARVLGHGSPDDRYNSIYMHTDSIETLNFDSLALIMLHEHMDAVRGRHENDIQDNIFYVNIKQPWNGMLGITQTENVAFNTYALASGVRTRAEFLNGREVHIRGVAPEPRRIINYIRALRTRTDDGRMAVPQVFRVYIPLLKIDQAASMANGEIVFERKTDDELPPETADALRQAAEQGIFELVELEEIDDYRREARNLNVDENSFIQAFTGTNSIPFVSEWVDGPNVYDFIAMHRDNPELMRRLGAGLARTQKALHRSGLICGDTHGGQFVVKGEAEEVLRVDLVNVYSVEEEWRENIRIEHGEIMNVLSGTEGLETFLDGYTPLAVDNLVRGVEGPEHVDWGERLESAIEAARIELMQPMLSNNIEGGMLARRVATGDCEAIVVEDEEGVFNLGTQEVASCVAVCAFGIRPNGKRVLGLGHFRGASLSDTKRNFERLLRRMELRGAIPDSIQTCFVGVWPTDEPFRMVIRSMQAQYSDLIKAIWFNDSNERLAIVVGSNMRIYYSDWYNLSEPVPDSELCRYFTPGSEARMARNGVVQPLEGQAAPGQPMGNGLALQDQNLIKGNIPEADIRAEQTRLINEGFAVAWNAGNVDQIITALEKDKLDDADITLMLSLFDNPLGNLNELLAEHLRSPPVKAVLLASIKAQKQALDDIRANPAKYAGMFKVPITQDNIDSLLNRRFVVFISDRGAFAEGSVLGHGSNDTSYNSVYMHTVGIQGLGQDGIALVMLHENMDAIRGTHEEDIDDARFDAVIRQPWEVIIARNTIEELLGDQNREARLEAARVLKRAENFDNIKLLGRVEVDWHTHTYHSDGYQTPTALVYEAYRRGLKAVAITDHNSFEGVEEAIEAGKIFGIEIIPGIEIMTSDYQRYGTEILAYWPNAEGFLTWFNSPNGIAARERFKGIAMTQEDMLWETAAAIMKAYPAIEINRDELASYARNVPLTVGSIAESIWHNYGPRVAEIVGSSEPINNSQDVYDRLVVKFMDFGDALFPTPQEAVRFAAANGGIAVLAHPKQYIKNGDSMDGLRAYVSELAEAGLKGLQVSDWRNSDEDTRAFRGLAQEFGLIMLAGSDYHGAPYSPVSTLALGGVTEEHPNGNLDLELGAYAQVAVLKSAQSAIASTTQAVPPVVDATMELKRNHQLTSHVESGMVAPNVTKREEPVVIFMDTDTVPYGQKTETDAELVTLRELYQKRYGDNVILIKGSISEGKLDTELARLEREGVSINMANVIVIAAQSNEENMPSGISEANKTIIANVDTDSFIHIEPIVGFALARAFANETTQEADMHNLFNLYKAISDEANALTEEEFRAAITNRQKIVIILPKPQPFDSDELKQLHEYAHELLGSA